MSDPILNLPSPAPDLLQSPFLFRFQCLGAECEDTCCKAWDMQVNEAILRKYREEAPELLAFVTHGDASEHAMKRDPESGYCVKFDHGLCAIHAEKGAQFLGDACYFYPRITRALGPSAVMTATPSCPEIVRLSILEPPDSDYYMPSEAPRLPEALKDYLPEGMTPEQALSVHTAFLHAVEDLAATPERVLCRLNSVVRSLSQQPLSVWNEAAPFYLRMAEGRLSAPEPHIEDPFNLLHALGGLVVASRKPCPVRLKETIAAMEEALEATLDWQNANIALSAHSHDAYANLSLAYREEWAESLRPLLRRWLRLQLSACLFPFAGLGGGMTERLAIISVRFATLRLALMAACAKGGGRLEAAETVRVIQSLARFLDHLADPAYSLLIYQEAGWLQEGRMRGVLEG